jgi:hypothetical protein
MKDGGVRAPKTVEIWSKLPRSSAGKVLNRSVRDHWPDQLRKV